MKKLLTDLVRALSLQLVIVLLLISLFVLGYIFRNDALVAYHRWGEKSSLRAMVRHYKPHPDKKYERSAIRHWKHQKALIQLGYYEQRSFSNKYLKAGSPQTEKMLAEFRQIYPGSSYSCGPGKDCIRITDRPERMSTWESLIIKYDVPPDEPNQPAASAEKFS